MLPHVHRAATYLGISVTLRPLTGMFPDIFNCEYYLQRRVIDGNGLPFPPNAGPETAHIQEANVDGYHSCA